MAAKFIIRPAVIEDAEEIYRFVYDLAVYEKAPEEVKTSPEAIRKVVFGPNSTVNALIAECTETKKAIGFAVYFFNYSTWLGRRGLYLEDLYVDPSSRGIGAGKALLRQLARIAVQNDCGRMEWVCLDWNTSAQEVYRGLGAFPMEGWSTWRLTGEALQTFGAAEDTQ